MNEFFFNNNPVGYFVGEDYPTGPGKFAFETYRGPGHYDLARLLQQGQPARCWFQHDGATFEFLVITAIDDEIVIESVTPAERPPSRRLVAQRMRNRIIESLQLASSFELQKKYQQAAAIHVPHEVINQWDDVVSLPLPAEYDLPVFSHSERDAMLRFDACLNRVCDETPDPLPELSVLTSDPHWEELRSEAAVALAVFAQRGKLPEDEEIA